jgi:hypothetical protein
MHGLRRKLSEPKIAGHGAAEELSIQRRTSAAVSVFARIISKECHTTH